MHEVARRTCLLLGTIFSVILARPVEEAAAVSSPTVSSTLCQPCESDAFWHWFTPACCEEGPFCMKTPHEGREPNWCGDGHDGCDIT